MGELLVAQDAYRTKYGAMLFQINTNILTKKEL